MELLVTCDRRMARTPDGQVWTPSIDDFKFWSRYLEVFDGVTVLSRVEDAVEVPSRWNPVMGPGVKVVALPGCVGPVQHARSSLKTLRICRRALAGGGAIILRAPGMVAFPLHGAMAMSRRPYGVEVIGDPYYAFAPGSIEHPLRPALRIVLMKGLALQCRGAAAASYVTEHALQERYPAGPMAFTTHYSSVSLPTQAFADGPKPGPPPGTPITVVSVGSMARGYKGFDILIDAAIALHGRGRSLRLLVVGGGRYLEELRRRALPLGSHASFTGELAGPERVREVLRGADLLVHPSFNEGLPRVVIEAMALGMPCIATRVGGTPELLAAEDIVEPGDQRSLECAIEACLLDPARLERAARRNFLKAAEYREEVLADRRRQMYRALEKATEEHMRRTA